MPGVTHFITANTKRVISLLLLAVALLALLLGSSTALAQEEGGVPPLPLVYQQGEVYMDGELLAEEAELTARVGDWESIPVAVRGGKFEILVVGPPSVAYVGREVTFHLQGLEASQRLTFPLLAEPSFETLRLDFPARPPKSEASPEEPDVSSAAVPSASAPAGAATSDEGPDIPWAMLFGVLAGGAVLIVMLNLAARRWLRLRLR